MNEQQNVRNDFQCRRFLSETGLTVDSDSQTSKSSLNKKEWLHFVHPELYLAVCLQIVNNIL